MLGFKCFLLPSGVEEFPPLGPAETGDIAAAGSGRWALLPEAARAALSE